MGKFKKSSAWVFKAASFLIVLFITLFFLQRLLMPKYMSDIVEGALIAEYYEETTDHDVLFVGDCEVYENFSPISLYEEYGITSYIRGSAQQLTWQSIFWRIRFGMRRRRLWYLMCWLLSMMSLRVRPITA